MIGERGSNQFEEHTRNYVSLVVTELPDFSQAAHGLSEAELQAHLHETARAALAARSLPTQSRDALSKQGNRERDSPCFTVSCAVW